MKVEIKGLTVHENDEEIIEEKYEKRGDIQFNYRCQLCGSKKLLTNLRYCPECKKVTPNDIEVVKSKDTDTKETGK